jgi:hypothetical protein
MNPILRRPVNKAVTVATKTVNSNSIPIEDAPGICKVQVNDEEKQMSGNRNPRSRIGKVMPSKRVLDSPVLLSPTELFNDGQG